MSSRAVKTFTNVVSGGISHPGTDNHDNEDDEKSNDEAGNRFALLEGADCTNEEIGNDNADRQPSNNRTKAKKKQKKKAKATSKSTAPVESAKQEEEIQRILDSLNGTSDASGNKSPFPASSTGADFRRSRTTETELLTIEYRHLNAENELKRIFGAATTKLFSSGGERRIAADGAKSRKKAGGVGGKLVIPKSTWPVFGKAGLAMKLVENRGGGVNVFTFEHGPVYRQAQYEFWEAVEMMNPDAFVEILRINPYHMDTLLQMSEVLRMQEDFQTSRDLVERAIYGCQAAFHPLFNVASASCRLEYKQRENRPFFLALFKHMQSLCQRACVRTALEFSKLIYSLDPDDDPLCMLLIIDYLALRSKQYDYLLDFYRIMEAKRNLSQLPNFCYSVALAYFLKASQDGASAEDADPMAEADRLLLTAVATFPTTLAALLEKCEVDAEDLKRCPAFSAYEQAKDGSGLQQLNALYAARYYQLWKEPQTLQWLERNVRTILPFIDDKVPSGGGGRHCETDYGALFQEFREHRRRRFQGTPRNILRHIVISDVKEALVQLPVEVRDSAILSYDPLPPLDSAESYERPERERQRGNDSFFGAFVRSLLPNYDPTAAAPAEEAAAVAEGGGVRGELQRSVHHLLEAMRDLLNNIQPAALPPEVNRDGNQGDREDDADAWEDERED